MLTNYVDNNIYKNNTDNFQSDEFDLFGCRVDEYLKFVEVQDKEMENFVGEKEKLCQAHEESLVAVRRRHWEEEVALEKKFDEELTQLMQKYSPSLQEK